MRQAGGRWPPRSAAQPVNLHHSSEQIFAPAKSAFPPSLAVKPESSLDKGPPLAAIILESGVLLPQRRLLFFGAKKSNQKKHFGASLSGGFL